MKTQAIKNIYLTLFSISVFILHIPFVFAKSKPLGEMPSVTTHVYPVSNSDSSQPVTNINIPGNSSCLYDSMHLDLMDLSKQVFNCAMKGFNYLIETGKLANDKIISIIDFSLPSSKKRLFVIDLNRHKVLFCTYVAHGVNSGIGSANKFSNKPESNKSSLGFYQTLNTYTGSNGYSLKLEGLEKGINDNAGRRDIVIHGAPYVSEALIRAQGYIGRSFGCPAVPEKLHKSIINKIKKGSCLFIYGPDKNYLRHSRILNSTT